jgi:A/G-specific adenine glycosylase
MKPHSKSNSTVSGERACPLAQAEIRRIRSKLLEHYDRHRRDLPWRRSPDPYRVWVSEVMLQQTRVDTVRPYYDRWLQRFPHLRALAEAPLDDVLKAWEGLGYYHRARNLHHAARLVCERYNGALPSETTQLRALPGIGDYTAGAIASIAFNQRAAVIDGNVHRVLHRLFDRRRIAPAALRELAALLVPSKRAGDFNQALMDLGATICTPRAPLCLSCPLNAECRARASGTQEQRPAPTEKRVIPEKHFNVVVLIDSHGCVLIQQRPAKGLLAGLWEFPVTSAKPLPFAQRLARDRQLALDEAGTVRHTFSHFRAHYRTWVGRVDGQLKANQQKRVVAWTDLSAFAMPTAQRRISALVAAPERTHAGVAEVTEEP